MRKHFVPSIAILALLAGASPANERLPSSGVQIKLIQQVEVPAREQGLLTDVAAREGAAFDTGAVLARVDDKEARLELERVKVELAMAKQRARNEFDLRTAEKEHEVATRNLRRAEQSLEKFEGSISAADQDQYQLRVDTTANDIGKARAELDLAQLNISVLENKSRLAAAKLARHVLIAPFRGIVVDVNRQPGEWVEPGESVLRIIRLDRLRAEGFFPANQVQGKLLGAPVKVQVKDGDAYHGVVVFVSPEVEPVNRRVRVYAEIENDNLSLRPGLKGVMTIQPRP